MRTRSSWPSAATSEILRQSCAAVELKGRAGHYSRHERNIVTRSAETVASAPVASGAAKEAVTASDLPRLATNLGSPQHDGAVGRLPRARQLPPIAGLHPVGTVGERGGNPAVWESVSAGKKQVMAWAYARPKGGRGFGFTGLHKHANLADENMRTLLLNAVAWVSKLQVPAKGVPSKALSRDDLERLIDEGKLAVKRRGI